MCKCLSDFVPPYLSCKCYIDCFYISFVSQRIALERPKSDLDVWFFVLEFLKETFCFNLNVSVLELCWRTRSKTIKSFKIILRYE